MPISPFDAVAEEYDAARPSYPDGLYQALEDITGPLAGKLVLDGGAGTGIATRQLAGRGARMVAFDIGERMLRRAQARSPDACFLLADGNAMPVRDRCADLVCFAQSWHWFDSERAINEVARVLRPGGYWAAWWNHEWADGEAWFHAYQGLLKSACPGYGRGHDDPAWAGEALTRSGLFEPGVQVMVRWTRTLSVGEWLTYERSKSYLCALSFSERETLLAQIADVADGRFHGGQMSVPYRTRLRMARRLSPRA
jgi:ubiquinone/menaquinone biosynthesis C-methylase UbiE